MCDNFMVFYELFHWILNIFIIETDPHHSTRHWRHVPWQIRILSFLIISRGAFDVNFKQLIIWEYKDKYYIFIIGL